MVLLLVYFVSGKNLKISNVSAVTQRGCQKNPVVEHVKKHPTWKAVNGAT